MQRTFKKLLSVLLCAALLCGAIPLTAVYAEDNPTSGTCGDNLTWSYDSSTNTLTISGTGEMTSYSATSGLTTAPWRPYYQTMQTVVINSGVTSICDWAFSNCTGLTSVTIGNSVTIIGVRAFNNCTGLTGVTIPNSVTTIDEYAFCACTSLTSVTIGNSVTSIGYGSFFLCRNLGSISIPNNVENIGASAFKNCFYLRSVTIGNNVSSIGSYAFESCVWLKSITIPNSVTSIGEKTFTGCTLLEAISVNANNPYYFSDGGVLYNKDKTELLQYPVGKNSTSFTIPDSVTVIDDGAFYHCAFLTEILVNESNANYSSDSGVLYNKDKTELIQCPAGNTRTSFTIPYGVAHIGYGAFDYCNKLNNVTIPDSIVDIGQAAFWECKSNLIIYFKGTQSQWNAVTIGYENTPLLNATMYFHDHTYTSAVTREPTCSEEGIRTFTCTDCGSFYTELIEKVSHTPKTVTVQPTCTEPGKYYDVCDVCGEKLTEDTVIPATGHHYDEGVITTEPTCAAEGVKTFTCADCGSTYTEPIAKLPHTPAEPISENEIKAGCTTTGSYDEVVYCSVCGAELSRTTLGIPATGHHYDEGVVTTEPTCAAEGVKTFTCGDCGHTYTESVAKLPHTPKTVTVPATCTEPGKYYDVCDICGEKLTEDTVIPATGHHYDEGVITTEPTCTEEGVKTFTCNDCGHTYTEPVAKLPHTPKTVTVPATCTEPGKYYDVCDVCGEKLTEDTVIPATGHHYDEGVITTEPTCAAEGVKTFTCADCDSTYTEPVAKLPHTPKTVTVPATCTEPGKYYDVCDVCGEKLTEDTVIPATGHHYDEGVITTEPTCAAEGVKTFTCADCGHTYTEPVAKLPHTPAEPISENEIKAGCTTTGSYDEVVYCSVCGAELSRTTRDIPATGHHYNDGVVTTEPTCAAEGVKTFTCGDCGHTYTESVAKLPHTPKTVTVPATCTEPGKYYDVCDVCGEKLTEDTVIPATGHHYDEGVITTEPTCAAEGVKTFTCADCDSTYTEPVAKLPHTPRTVTVPATCVEDGKYYDVCDVCGEKLSEDTVIPATGHTYSEWMMLVDPTLTSDGVMGRKCTACGVVLDQMTVPKLAGDHVTGVRLSSEKEYLNRNETLTLTATITPATAQNKNVIWTSTNPAVATVENGVVTAVAPGIAIITATAEDGGDRDYCLIQVNAVTPQNGSLIDNGVISGLSVNLNSLEEYLVLADKTMALDYSSAVIGTGTKVQVKQGETVINEFETVIFGDVDGNSWYDGTDAYFVRLVASGMVSADALTDAQRIAADCNHDGVIDMTDAALLEQAGVLLANVDQSASNEELQTDSAYLAYCGLIDQTIETVEPAADEKPQPSAQNLFSRIMAFFNVILNWLMRIF